MKKSENSRIEHLQLKKLTTNIGEFNFSSSPSSLLFDGFQNVANKGSVVNQLDTFRASHQPFLKWYRLAIACAKLKKHTLSILQTKPWNIYLRTDGAVLS